MEPLLHDVITHNILHGPCNTYNTSILYIYNKKYKFRFPYTFQKKTIVGNNNKPLYKRLWDSLIFTKLRQSYIYNSKDVVSYNAYFLTHFNAHINVKSYVRYCAIKYTFKYIYKGPNYTTITLKAQAAGVRLQQPMDEIKEYVDIQYITTHEALQRIYKYCIYSRFIPMQQLTIHPKGQQFIVIQPN